MVRLTESWRDAMQRRATVGAFAPPVRRLLGEMTAAAALMQSSIKFDGTLILQLHGDGPVKLAVAEARADLSFRATAKVVSAVAPTSSLQDLVNSGGQGRCAITLDPKKRPPGSQPYQGVVPLHDDQRLPLTAFAQVIEHYMLQSEQLDTRLILAASDDVAAGLLLQRMPVTGAGNLSAAARDDDQIGTNEDFNRIAQLAATLTREELLGLDVDTVLRRLFWQENVRRFAPLTSHFNCSCARERVRNMLLGLGRAELDSILVERNEIEVGCDFCGQQYHFDAVDVGAMFTSPQVQAPASRAMH